jgi:DNA-binding PadR family transcriptional regulator
MPVRYAILSLLDGRELHGYRIKSVFAERMGPFWTLNFGQIYQVLKDLKRRSLVSARFSAGDGHLGRWMYTITPKGRRALDTWLARAPRAPGLSRDEVYLRLLATERHPLEGALEQLGKQRQACAEQLARARGVRHRLEAATPAGFTACLIADAAVFHAEAHLRWLDHCAGELRRRAAPLGDERGSVAGRA